MTRKSRKVAARYSALSREKKKKQHPRPPFAPGIASDKADQAMERPAPAVAAVTTATARPKGEAVLPSLRHVKGDLKRIGVIAGSIVVVLIILSFVLR